MLVIKCCLDKVMAALYLNLYMYVACLFSYVCFNCHALCEAALASPSQFSSCTCSGKEPLRLSGTDWIGCLILVTWLLTSSVIALKETQSTIAIPHQWPGPILSLSTIEFLVARVLVFL